MNRAEKRVEEASEQLKTWKLRDETLREEVATAEASIGSEALASGDLEAAADRLAILRGQSHAASETVKAAEAQLAEAKQERSLAEARDLRTEAAKLEKQAESHAAKTRELLDALEAHEGGRYTPEQPSPGTASNLPFWVPRTEQLRAQAENANGKADRLERQTRANSRPRAGAVST